MSNRFLYIMAVSVGSFIGGYIPSLWGGSMFSFSSIFLSALGGIVGIWLVYKLLQ